MTSPLRNAARALCKAQSGVDCFDDLEPEAQEIAIETVRAVILAIREPSPEILQAGFEDYPTIWTAGVTPEDRVGMWAAMIDAALSEQP